MRGIMKRTFWKGLLIVMALGMALAPACWAAGKQGEKTRGRERSKPALEVEPSLPLSLQVRLVNLQKNPKGGVASVALHALSDSDMDGVTVTVTLPQEVTFADGSHVFTQTLRLSAGSTLEIPKDLLVGKDGKYVVQVEAAGTTPQGKLVHRGTAFKLLVGAQESLPPVKDGAIEYQGVPGGGF
ncbi:MAG: hypothetical protein DMH00_06060 [Acidobacteria bacterium]|nr:MAG: hypothetical protein DMH00_06060 [Acidobacteriota bacterium]